MSDPHGYDGMTINEDRYLGPLHKNAEQRLLSDRLSEAIDALMEFDPLVLEGIDLFGMRDQSLAMEKEIKRLRQKYE